MNSSVEIMGISIPEIRVFKDGDEIIVLHKEPNKSWDQANSLLSFTLPNDGNTYLLGEIGACVNRACFGLDWNKDFDVVFNTEAYRRAVMNIPNFLIGE